MREGPPNWLPDWLSTIAAPVWVSAPDGGLAWLNGEAQALLGCEATAVLGAPCSEVVAGVECSGRHRCARDCPVRQRAAQGHALAPLAMRTGDGRGLCMLVVVAALRAPDGSHPWLVHCAGDVDRLCRSACYLEHLAGRSPAGSSGRRPLTRRQREVLGLLAQDDDLRRTARRLHVSHATVRNHARDILARLGVHSLQEAIALHVLDDDGGGRREPPASA